MEEEMRGEIKKQIMEEIKEGRFTKEEVVEEVIDNTFKKMEQNYLLKDVNSDNSAMD